MSQCFHKYLKPNFKRPWTKIEVIFHSNKLKKSFKWDALLDTGSAYTVLPGEVHGKTNYSEKVVIELYGLEHEQWLELPFRTGRPVKFGPVGSEPEDHYGFTADFQVFGLNWVELQTIYFDRRLKHAIIGTDILFDRGAICFLKDSYRVGRCWLSCICR